MDGRREEGGKERKEGGGCKKKGKIKEGGKEG